MASDWTPQERNRSLKIYNRRARTTNHKWHKDETSKTRKRTANADCENDESVDHLVSGWSKIAQTDYETRHDLVTMVHRNLCMDMIFSQKCSRKTMFKKKNLRDFQIETNQTLRQITTATGG